MPSRDPIVVLLAGPNGAGKSTLAPTLLRDREGIFDFVNADTIAQGLSAFSPEAQAFRAGRIMLEQLHALARDRRDFAFETTLATRSYAPWLRRLRADGYAVEVIFLWLPSADLAVARVAERARRGGHNVPEADVRRRHERGLRNFGQLYAPLASAWHVYENASPPGPVLLAVRRQDQTKVHDVARWAAFEEAVDG